MNMSIKKIIVCAILVGSFVSCKKVLNVEPQFNLDGTTRFNTISDYDFALVGTYRLFRSTSYYGAANGASNAFATLPDALSDNLNETSESLGNQRVFSNWAYAKDENQVENTWLAAYRIISQANLVLTGIDKLSATDAGAVNRIKAQALAIRALVHFDILRYWVDDYDRNSTLPGVPYITRFDYEQKPSRGTVKQTYDSIEFDLATAKALMADMDKPINTGSINSGTSKAYIDATGVNAILARMYLYSNQLDSVIKYATLVINARPLAGRTDFPRIWQDASTAEVIWSVVFDAGQGLVGGNVYFPPSNRSEYRPNPTLVSTYSQVSDIRYPSYFQIRNTNGGNPRLVLSKYLGKEAQYQLSRPDGVVNFKAFRTGEMYLIRAEAYARQGDDVDGLADLNALRAARISGFVPGIETGAALLSAIELERRKELIAEGHRWFDLKRTTRMVNRTNCTTSFCTLLPGDPAWTWPIPQPEIDANPNILPQNPGY
jgi:starch-binding outer membrane protein, SusD/RagB family